MYLRYIVKIHLKNMNRIIVKCIRVINNFKIEIYLFIFMTYYHYDLLNINKQNNNCVV